MKGDNSESKRFFGLIAKVDYTDGTAADYHYVPFDCNYTDWQYASASVVPKQRNKTVSTITVITAYDYNVNVGHFDDISLVVLYLHIGHLSQSGAREQRSGYRYKKFFHNKILLIKC